MPSAPRRPCPGDGGLCGELVERGRCDKHALVVEQQRGTATERGYDSYWSKVFRPWFRQRLIAADIAPACGAALPGGPSMGDSQCKAEGYLNAINLHLDHDPPLRDDERADRRTVCDELRVGFLCASCHSRKTRREQDAGRR